MLTSDCFWIENDMEFWETGRNLTIDYVVPDMVPWFMILRDDRSG
jgi:hypothetical protein